MKTTIQLSPCPHRSERGQALILFALSLTMLMGLAGFVIDFGRILYVRRVLQASSDAAATAGAMEIISNNGAPAISMATTYSSVSGNLNARANITGVTMTATVKCTNFMAQQLNGTTCAAASPANPLNTIVVTQSVTLPMTLARAIGITSRVVTATSTATARGGTMPPLDINIVLDATGSMDGTPLNQAKAGIQTLLGVLWPCPQGVNPCGTNPVVDQVGLYVFHPVTAASVAREYDCSTSTITPVGYESTSPTPIYQILQMSNNYRLSTTAALNTSSNLVRAIGGGGSGCSQGIESTSNPTESGVSYAATAITQAQANLVSTGRANVQNVIIFLGDGDYTRYPGGPSIPCQRAITAAQNAKDAGTWVYSIGYGIDGGGCADDSSLNALQTMQRINSDYPLLTKFFNVPNAADLTATFRKIGIDLLTTRLVGDDTL